MKYKRKRFYKDIVLKILIFVAIYIFMINIISHEYGCYFLGIKMNDNAEMILMSVYLIIDSVLYIKVADFDRHNIKLIILSSSLCHYWILINYCIGNGYYAGMVMTLTVIVSLIILNILFRTTTPKTIKARNVVELYKKKRKHYIVQRYKKYCVISYICSVMMIFVVVYLKIGRNLENPQTVKIADNYDSSYMTSEEELFYILDQHEEELKVLKQEYYMYASEEDIESATQTLADCICEYLRIENHSVRFEEFKDQGRAGSFDIQSGQILLTSKYLSEPYYRIKNCELFDSLAHEIRHGYQEYILRWSNDNDINLDLAVYDYARHIKANKDNGYIMVDDNSSERDFEAYNSQYIEMDCNTFAKEMASLLYNYFNR